MGKSSRHGDRGVVASVLLKDDAARLAEWKHARRITLKGVIGAGTVTTPTPANPAPAIINTSPTLINPAPATIDPSPATTNTRAA
jgi:hypothetical protein